MGFLTSYFLVQGSPTLMYYFILFLYTFTNLSLFFPPHSPWQRFPTLCKYELDFLLLLFFFNLRLSDKHNVFKVHQCCKCQDFFLSYGWVIHISHILFFFLYSWKTNAFIFPFLLHNPALEKICWIRVFKRDISHIYPFLEIGI